MAKLGTSVFLSDSGWKKIDGILKIVLASLLMTRWRFFVIRRVAQWKSS
jgi:hypothetical protein